MAKLGVDTSGVAPDTGSGSVMPAPGPYQFYLIEGEVKDNSKGTGKYFKFTAECIEGEYKGCKVRDLINFIHDTPRTQNIGQGQLKALKMACGLPDSCDETDDFLWQPFWAEVVIEPYTTSTGAQKESNKFSKFLFETEAHSPPQAKQPPKAANDNAKAPPAANDNRQSPAAVKPNMPWKRPA